MTNWGFILWLLGLSVINFIVVAWLLDISNRQRERDQKLEQFLTDAGGLDIAQPLERITDRLSTADEQVQRFSNELEQLKKNLPQSIQAVSLVRFQAFADFGGDQSFALAMADVAGDGVVLTGLFAREGSRVYAKPLSGWASSYSLSFEEEEAIKQARAQIEENEESA
jgi:hypothetical protein